MNLDTLITLVLAGAGLLKLVFDVGMIRGSIENTLKQIVSQQKTHGQQLQAHSLKFAEYEPRIANLEKGAKCR